MKIIMKNHLLSSVHIILFLFMSVSLFGQDKAIPAEPEKFWPKTITGEQGKLILYQPQLEKLEEDRLEARAAIAVTMAEKPSTIYGALWFECRIETDYDQRMVYLKEVKVTASKFPDLDQERIDRISRYLEKEVPSWEYSASLDDLLLSLEGAEYEAQLAQNLNNTPPEIIFSEEPAALILVDGEPVFKPVDKTDYNYVVNTAFFIVQEKNGGALYLKGGNYWFTSGNIRSEWKNIANPPKKVLDIAKTAMGEEAQPIPKDSVQPPVPKIYLRTRPAELLQSQGAPEYAPVEGTELLYMTNTADYILMDIDDQLYYTVISGRWYYAGSLNSGRWEYLPAEELPEDFARIPQDSDLAGLRANIPGTPEAKEAVLANQIPQTAEVSRKDAKLEVTYDGEPKFEPVGDTGMKYAINTDKSVLLIDGRYYCCEEAIWFESSTPNGPWSVSTSVPEKVREIPPDNPTYNVKYVYIYDYTPDVVYVGYTPGYCYSFVYGPTVVYGTGYYYAPWYGVYYYPRPVTYGFGVNWNPYTGWSFTYGISIGGPYGWFSFGWHPPYYGGYWGPVGYRHGYYHGYNRGYIHGYYDGKHSGGGYYGHRGGSSGNVPQNLYANRANRPDGGVRTSTRPATSPAPVKEGTQRPSSRPAQRPEPATRPAPGGDQRPSTVDMPNNLVTGRDGSIYRKEGDEWQKRENDDWSKGVKPSSNDVLRDYDNRQRSQERTQTYQQNRPQYQQTRPSGTYNRSGSVPSGRPSGGGGAVRGGRR